MPWASSSMPAAKYSASTVPPFPPMNSRRAAWCAWQESNLLPLAPQASALSGELQAQVVQFRRASIAAVAALNAAASRLLTTTRATKTDLTFEVAPSSALQAAGLAVKSEMAPAVAPFITSCCHCVPTRAASAGSAWARLTMYTSIGPEPRHTFNPDGMSSDCRMAVVGESDGVGLGGAGLNTGCVPDWHAASALRARIAMSRCTKRAV